MDTDTTNSTSYLWVGAYTNQGSKGIYRFQFDDQSGELSDKKLMAETSNPSFLTFGDDGILYAVNENDPGGVSSFRWDRELDSLILISNRPTFGIHPCYVDYDSKKNLLGIANYSSGNVSVFKVDQSGTLSAEPQLKQHQGNGPNTGRQEGPHAHCTVFKGNYLYAVDLGIDRVLAYPVVGDSLNAPRTAVRLDPGDGPRLLIFHPNDRLAFLVNELSNTVVSLQFNSISGALNVASKTSTLPDDFTDHSQAAHIQLSPDGEFLYVSNRGHNSIAVFKVEPNGQLERVATTPSGGDWPRNFTLSPDGKFMLVAHQYSGNIVVFAVDQESGLLTATGQELQLSEPVYLGFSQ